MNLIHLAVKLCLKALSSRKGRDIFKTKKTAFLKNRVILASPVADTTDVVMEDANAFAARSNAQAVDTEVLFKSKFTPLVHLYAPIARKGCRTQNGHVLIKSCVARRTRNASCAQDHSQDVIMTDVFDEDNELVTVDELTEKYAKLSVEESSLSATSRDEFDALGGAISRWSLAEKHSPGAAPNEFDELAMLFGRCSASARISNGAWRAMGLRSLGHRIALFEALVTGNKAKAASIAVEADHMARFEDAMLRETAKVANLHACRTHASEIGSPRAVTDAQFDWSCSKRQEMCW